MRTRAPITCEHACQSVAGMRVALELYLGALQERLETPGWLYRATEELRGQAPTCSACRLGGGLCHGEVMARVMDGEPYCSVRDSVLERLARAEGLAKQRQMGLFERVA